jgi:hypothetical protein
MLVVIRNRVSHLIQEGKTEQKTLAAHPTADYDARIEGSKTTADRLVRQMYRELKDA